MIIVGTCRGATNRAVSLKVLESVLKSGQSAQASHLCGITRISGYIVDKKNKDIILFGQVDPDYPTLYLDDFVVALRNSRMVYARLKGRTYYYSAPGCSIDPNPKILRELQQLSEKIGGINDPDKKRNAFEEWKAIGGSPQKVRVMGVPLDTRFAKVMVDADYYMKRLVDGSEKLDIPGFISLMDMSIKESELQLQSGDADDLRGGSISRFWFCPGESTFDEDDDATFLTSCKVKLLTEEEFLTEKDSIAGMGRQNPMARKFADSFSAHYQEIAAQRSIYKEMEGLFRFVAIANLMRDQKATSSAGCKLSYLGGSYKVGSVPTSRTLPGITSVKVITNEEKTEIGRSVSYLWHMSCGGVSMDVHPKRIRATRTVTTSSKTSESKRGVAKAGGTKPAVAAAKAKSTMKKAVLTARKSSTELYWDFPEGK